MDLMYIIILVLISWMVWALVEIKIDDIKNNYAKMKNLNEKKNDVDDIEKM